MPTPPRITAPTNYTDSDPTDDSATDTSVATPIADLAVTKTNGATTSVPGSPTTYTIVVTNAGPSTATDALVVDTLPTELPGASWTCAATPGATCAATTGTGSLDELVTVAPGATVTYSVTADVASAATGSFTNTVTVDAPSGTTDPDPSDNTADDTDDLTPEVDLAITKTDGATSVTPGTPTTYSIVVTNTGPSDVVGATVVDTLPAVLTDATWSCASSLGSSCPGSGSGDIDVLVDLVAGGTATFTVNGTVAAGATGILSNTATVAAPTGVTDTDRSNDSATDESTLSPTADLRDHEDGRGHVLGSRYADQLHDHRNQRGPLRRGRVPRSPTASRENSSTGPGPVWPPRVPAAPSRTGPAT